MSGLKKNSIRMLKCGITVISDKRFFSVLGVFWFVLGLLFFFFFWLFSTVPTAYGSSQARGLIRAAAGGLHPSHGNARSELHL